MSNNGEAMVASSANAYLGIGVGVGAAILILCGVVAYKVWQKRIEHKRAVEALDAEIAVSNALRHETSELPRPIATAPCSAFGPLQSRAGWGALTSGDTVNEPGAAVQKHRRSRSSVRLPKRFRSQRGVPLRKLNKRLTAIIESPTGKPVAPPAVPPKSALRKMPDAATVSAKRKAYTLLMTGDEDVFHSPGSPRPDVLPSFAIRSPGRYGAGIASGAESSGRHHPPTPRSTRSEGRYGIRGKRREAQRASRSKSLSIIDLSTITKTSPADDLVGKPTHLRSRSFSFGAPRTAPPSEPLPPLPVIAPHGEDAIAGARQGLWVRMSSASTLSTSSSVLISSPIVKVAHPDDPVPPSIEDVVAQDATASLKTVLRSSRSTASTRRARPDDGKYRPSTIRMVSNTSIKSNIAQYSVADTPATNDRSSSFGSTSSTDVHPNRLSIPKIGTADRVSISPASPKGSLRSRSTVRKITTPRRLSKISVSANGSPVNVHSVLRDISGNANGGASRTSSTTTYNSGRSSSSNPFQLDQPQPKHSALKGSPNARGKYRRQACVRISTLTPQVLGPECSRNSSPDVMQNIEEEPTGYIEDFVGSPDVGFGSNAFLFTQSVDDAENARHGSLRPDSPSLSAWPATLADHEAEQASVHSPESERSATRQSIASSLTIPAFPSPVRPNAGRPPLTRSEAQADLSPARSPKPQAVVENSAPFVIANSSDDESGLTSSPPPIPAHVAYDPASATRPVGELAMKMVAEYDPTSPEWHSTADQEKSSPFLPFASKNMASALESEANEDKFACSQPSSAASSRHTGAFPDKNGSCRPGAPPFDHDDFHSTPESGSAAPQPSGAVGCIPPKLNTESRTVEFPGAPVLLPTSGSDSMLNAAASDAKNFGSHGSISTTAFGTESHIDTTKPQPPLLTHFAPSLRTQYPASTRFNFSSSIPKPGPAGPRARPSRSVMTHVNVLRRMNSEADVLNTQHHRASLRYRNLGREASLELPWTPHDDYSEMEGLFDFDRAGRASDDEDEAAAGALIDLNMADLERKVSGALAGIDGPGGERRGPAGPRNAALPREPHARLRAELWESGEKRWMERGQENQPPKTDVDGGKGGSPSDGGEYDGRPRRTLRREERLISGSPTRCGRVSAGAMPRILYDAEGFLHP